MRRLILPSLATLVLLLTACSAATPTAAPTAAPTSVSTEPGGPSGDLTRSDQQGMVVVEVTPLNLGSSGDTLEFDVALNTHSVDLSMDLTSLATLTTDAGITVAATKWDAPSGGHHVSGKLFFPGTKDGKSILDGASKLTLAILSLDAASRVFEWELK